MGVGLFAGFVSAIIVCSVADAGFFMWLFFLVFGPIFGAIAVGMVSNDR